MAEQQIVQQGGYRRDQIKQAGDLHQIAALDQPVQQEGGQHRNHHRHPQQRQNKCQAPIDPQRFKRQHQRTHQQPNRILQRQYRQRRLAKPFLQQSPGGHAAQRDKGAQHTDQ
ncbi:hypothetical protein D3C78_1624220 [compost metagenome]